MKRIRRRSGVAVAVALLALSARSWFVPLLTRTTGTWVGSPDDRSRA